MGIFGTALDPSRVGAWQAATGVTPDVTMSFDAWSAQRSPAPLLDRVKQLGHRELIITWEPWQPTAPGEGQGAPQPRWSPESIIDGEHDAYIDMYASALRASGLTVWLRFAHEMNGTWYPWSIDAEAYAQAWRYLRYRIRTGNRAWNVRMMWSPNLDLYRRVPADWLRGLMPYWPGAAHVDLVGFTMINFGGDKSYPVALFRERVELARDVFGKAVVAPECNVALDQAVDWLTGMAEWMEQDPLPLWVLSQPEVSGAEVAGGTGDLTWSVTGHPETHTALRRLSEALGG